MNDTERLKFFTVLMILAAALMICIGVGYIFGAGFGWLLLGIFILGRGMSVLKFLKEDGT